VPPDTESRSESIDLVIGSGRKGQTYLYWKGNQLFQLPISYWTELNQWVNSPGYKDGNADFTRRVPPRCLECHATFFKSTPPPINQYQRSNFVLGLACERCHGPGGNHLATQQAKQQASSGSDIVNPAKLSTERQIDLCALCHAGLGEPARAPVFSFLPGNRIADYLSLPSAGDEVKIDVHGSQVELLRRSRCFRESKTMTCLTCHDVHTTQRDAAAFSTHCLSCHKVASCGLYAQRGESLAQNCVDCHMPKQPTELIVSDSNGRKVKPEVRNHQIKIYGTNAP
jgi:Cytochrome c554 and c-prime